MDPYLGRYLGSHLSECVPRSLTSRDNQLYLPASYWPVCGCEPQPSPRGSKVRREKLVWSCVWETESGGEL